MADNYEIEARGFLFWSERTRSVRFRGQVYQVPFAELGPGELAESRTNVLNDHTVELTVSDPNGLI